MKISEMSNEQAAQALIDLTEPISRICDDQQLEELLEKYRTLKEESMFKTIGQLLPRIISYAIKDHKDDIYKIVSVLIGKPISEVAEMKLFDTIKVVRESYDEVLVSFFTSLGKPIKTTGE